MSTLITVEVDGKTLPITSCYWIQTAPCGCTVSLTTTSTTKGDVTATAEQAHKRLVPLKRERDDDNKRGYTWALVTKTLYHADIAKQWECDQHTAVTA